MVCASSRYWHGFPPKRGPIAANRRIPSAVPETTKTPPRPGRHIVRPCGGRWMRGPIVRTTQGKRALPLAADIRASRPGAHTGAKERLTPEATALSDFKRTGWCRRRGSNSRPSVYKTAALPLCYAGPGGHRNSSACSVFCRIARVIRFSPASSPWRCGTAAPLCSWADADRHLAGGRSLGKHSPSFSGGDRARCRGRIAPSGHGVRKP